MTKAAFIKQNGALAPCDDDGRELLAALKDDKEVMVEFHAPRNIRHHRKLMLLLQRIVDGGAWDGDTDSLLKWLKFATGLVDVVVSPKGRAFSYPQSIKFESMPQDKFARWYDRAIYVISTELLGGEECQALRAEIDRIIDGDIADRLREHDERFGRAA